ncbi:MAG: ATP-dependent DNA ligase [Candidatus Aenigmarchaeota archaeon]|nr:ATP-dependent DNA ligase [Candidatus Aenigmarchaeota archaeon]
MEKRKQVALAKRELTTDQVFDNLRKLPSIAGQGSQDKKIGLIAELLSAASPKEARYIVRTALGQMRIGVAAGIVRDAIAKAFDKEPKEIERIYDILGDFGKVAEMAKRGKLKAEIIVGIPLRVMLADRAADLKEAMEKFEHVAIETKYDGFRVQIHKNNNDVRIFSRRMDDVTRQFPDMAAMAKEGIKCGQCIVEGEALAIKAGRPQPFQLLSKRIQRKYHIERMVKEIPVQVNLFDLLYIDGETYMNQPLAERWSALKKAVKESKSFRLADHIETKDFAVANKFYKSSIASGQEGVIVKNSTAHYQPGKRVGYWLKVKEILDPLDLVVVGAEWGEGRRARWFSSVILAARDKGKLVSTGRMASGFTEEQLEELTKTLKPLIIGEEGKIAAVKPKVVLEIGYEELQKSPKYESGYAMRFPRLLNFRSDKSPEDCTTLKEIEKIYSLQRGRK